MKFFSSSLWTISGNILTGIISLLLSVYLSRKLGPSGIGVLTIVIIIASLVALMLDSGISISNVFFYRAKKISKDILFVNSSLWSIIVGAAAVVLIYFCIDIFPDLIEINDHTLLFLGLSLIPFYLFLNLQRQLLLACEKVIEYNFSNVMQSLFVLIFVVLFFNLWEISSLYAVLAYLVTSILMSLHVTWVHRVKSLKYDLKTLRKSIKFGFFGHLGTMTQRCNSRLDVVILGALANSTAVGIYSISYTCAEVLLRFPRAIGMIVYPKISGLDNETADLFTIKLFKLTNIILLLLAICVAVTGYVLIPVLFGKVFLASVNPFLVLLPGVFFFGWNNILIEDLKGRGYPNYKLYTATLALVVTITLDLLLIPYFGVLGAAIASSVAYTVSGLFSLYLFCHKTNNSAYDLLRVEMSDVRYILHTLINKILKK